MEFEDIREEIERELRRVAEAFEVRELQAIPPEDIVYSRDFFYHGITHLDTPFRCYLDKSRGTFTTLVLGELRIGCGVELDPIARTLLKPEHWQCFPSVLHPQYNQQMAHGLYRLGFEDESVLSQLPALSAHEKVELRLSLPREFWPQAWLDE